MTILGIAGLATGVLNLLKNSQNTSQNNKSDFDKLADSLQSGDITGAKNALAAVQKDINGMMANQSPTSLDNTTLNNDLNAISNNLNQGNTAASQQALGKLQHDVQNIMQGLHFGSVANTNTAISQFNANQGSGVVSLDQLNFNV
jgi:hypothetical protein